MSQDLTGIDELLQETTEKSEVLKFYNDTVTLYYNGGLHAYYLEDPEDGTKYLVPHCTTVVGKIDKSGPLTQWAANMAILSLRQQLEGCVRADGGLSYLVPTTKMDEMLSTARLHFRKVQDDAKDIGKVAHDWLEGWVKAQIAGTEFARPLPVHDEQLLDEKVLGAEGCRKATNCITAALEWFSRHKVRFVYAERKVFSRRLCCSGTADWFGYLTSCGDPTCCHFEGEKFTCGDYKSSKELWDEYRIQLSFYMEAWNEEFPEQPVELRLLMRLDKEGDSVETLLMTPDEFSADFDAFLGALQIYVWQRQLDLDRRFTKEIAKRHKKALKAAEDAAKPKRVRKAKVKHLGPIPILIDGQPVQEVQQ